MELELEYSSRMHGDSRSAQTLGRYCKVQSRQMLGRKLEPVVSSLDCDSTLL